MPPKWATIVVRQIVGLIPLTAIVLSPSRADELSVYKSEIGYWNLEARLASVGELPPTGAGVRAMQVEAAMPTNRYLPEIASRFSELFGKTVHPQSGPGGGPSSHATTVGRSFYGPLSSIAPQIGSVDGYMADDYLFRGYLLGLEALAPRREEAPPQVQNHSWVSYGIPGGGGFTTSEISADFLRRLDLVIERDSVISVVGVANAPAMPTIFAAAYNAIAVGTSDARSSIGPTTTDVPGRCKPDLVAPGKFPRSTNTTSIATPRVAAAAALLVEAARRGPTAAAAEQPQTIKALLLAGASKEDLPGWSHDDQQPLDLRYGAGLLNIDNSHRILTAGLQRPDDARLVASTGWDYGRAEPGKSRHYVFECQAPISRLSIAAAWLRHIEIVTGAGQGGSARLRPSLANIDIKLHSAYEFEPELQLAQSVSRIENVEHIYQTDLPAGRYLISLTSDQAWNFALAWDARPVASRNPLAWILWGAGIGALGLFRGWGRSRR